MVKFKQRNHHVAHSPFFVKLIPELSAAALKAGLDKELALWYELRAINSSGNSIPGQQCSNGFLDLDYAVAALVKHFAYTQRTAYRLLRAGNGKLWDIYNRRVLKAGSVIKIRGLSWVAQYFYTSVLSLSRPVAVKVSDFKGSRVNKTAQLYASFFKPNGSRAKPISRDSIEAATGVSRCRQKRYDKVAGIKRVANFACRQDGNGRLTPILHLVDGKSRQWLKHRRLGNTYHSQAHKAPRGMIKRVNAELRQWSLFRDESHLLKRFFLSARSLVRTPERHNEAFLLVNKGDRVIRGRMEWCIV